MGQSNSPDLIGRSWRGGVTFCIRQIECENAAMFDLIRFDSISFDDQACLVQWGKKFRDTHLFAHASLTTHPLPLTVSSIINLAFVTHHAWLGLAASNFTPFESDSSTLQQLADWNLDKAHHWCDLLTRSLARLLMHLLSSPLFTQTISRRNITYHLISCHHQPICASLLR